MSVVHEEFCQECQKVTYFKYKYELDDRTSDYYFYKYCGECVDRAGDDLDDICDCEIELTKEKWAKVTGYLPKPLIYGGGDNE